MKKKSFVFKNPQDFEGNLGAFKQWHGENGSPKMFFQIYSEILDEGELKIVGDVIEKVFPDVPWMGISTSGNIVNCEVSGKITVVANMFEFPTTMFKIFQYDLSAMKVDDITRDIIKQSKEYPWVKGIEMYHTISSFSTTRFCDGMRFLRSDIQMFGGIVCSPDITSPESCVFSSVGGYCKTGLLIAFYGGEDFHVKSVKISGWKPLGRNFHVTKAKGNILYELSGMPAYDVYRRYLNIKNDSNFFYNALEFPMLYEHNSTTIVRAPAASNQDGSLCMSSDVETGSIIRLSYGEPQTIVNSINDESAKLYSFRPEVLHIFSCAARKAFWASHEPTYEIYPFKKVAESMGFFSHGEFLRESGFLNQHNITLVVAAMREGPGKVIDVVGDLSDPMADSKLPLAARMATFIRETSFELEEMNSKLQVMNKQLQNIATTDSLTGLENRLAFDEFLSKISNEDDDADTEWVILMIDVNGLKYTNDTFGHLAGDALIIAAANVIVDAYGHHGKCFRVGGDEFVVIVDATSDMMYKLHCKLKRSIAEYNKEAMYHLSLAVGESRLKNDFGRRKPISDWKMEADLNMYHNKALSHNSRAVSEQNQNMKELIDCMISIEEAKDAYTAHHSERVCCLAELIARLLGLSDTTLLMITDAAQLHDIGKVGISDAILTKTSKLTEDEFSVIKQHPVIGAKILMQSNYMQDLVQIVLHHHERYDGKGYPEGLAGENIPLGARILAIADSIDAITSRRVYRDAMSMDYCRNEIERNRGEMYDPAIAQVVLEHWSDIVDTLLKLHSGRGKRPTH